MNCARAMPSCTTLKCTADVNTDYIPRTLTGTLQSDAHLSASRVIFVEVRANYHVLTTINSFDEIINGAMTTAGRIIWLAKCHIDGKLLTTASRRCQSISTKIEGRTVRWKIKVGTFSTPSNLLEHYSRWAHIAERIGEHVNGLRLARAEIRRLPFCSNRRFTRIDGRRHPA